MINPNQVEIAQVGRNRPNAIELGGIHPTAAVMSPMMSRSVLKPGQGGHALAASGAVTWVRRGGLVWSLENTHTSLRRRVGVFVAKPDLHSRASGRRQLNFSWGQNVSRVRDHQVCLRKMLSVRIGGTRPKSTNFDQNLSNSPRKWPNSTKLVEHVPQVAQFARNRPSSSQNRPSSSQIGRF